MKPHIADFLKFLESKDNRKIPLVAKLLYPDKFNITKEDLNIEGDLDFEGTGITTLPDNLTVRGHLNLSHTKIKSLPDNLEVGVILSIEYTKINSIPNNLKVGGNLHLWDTPLGWNLSTQQIRQEIERKGGYIKGNIIKS